jgi:hypothetical protein
MATKLNVDTGGLDIGKKLWEKHQADEYTRVDNYKEAICINCFKKDATSATVADICGECAGKRGSRCGIFLKTVNTYSFFIVIYTGIFISLVFLPKLLTNVQATSINV